MFQLKNVSKKYGENIALNNVSLSIKNGMNFIVGASGSGKSTLLKIMAGIDNDFEGEVYLYDKNVRSLTKKEKSSLYNNTIGFIWQDFNLIDDYTVIDNLLLPSHLNAKIDMRKAEKLISDLKLKKVAYKKVKFLSGGQKQRVAIARELMKNPKVILADEPTSALDKQTSKEIMKILRNISKVRPVIIITHDTSHILAEDTIFELDKGELISRLEDCEDTCKVQMSIPKTSLRIKHALSIVKTNIFCNKGKFLISLLSFVLSVCFLLTTFTNSIANTSQSEFDKVFNMYGESVLDITLANSFVGGSGTGNNNDNPNVNVEQSLNGLFEKYKNDKRINFISYLKAFENITIQDENKSYSIQASNNVPVINKLIVGRLGNDSGKEVVIPESFAKEMKLSPKEALDKVITFNGEVVEWNGNKPTIRKLSSKVKIVGVIESSIVTVFEGKKYEYPIDDSFFFSESALSDLYKESVEDIKNLNIIMRAKTPEDMISIKDELNKNGLVPIGNFEVIEDLVRLKSLSVAQSGTASLFITISALIMLGAISLITSLLKKKKYAIFKISGFSNTNLRKVHLFEGLIQTLSSFIALILFSPFINMLSDKLFNIKVITFSNLGVVISLLFGVAILSFIITEIVCETTNVLKVFKTEE